MANWRVWAYDMWGNVDEGFEVNDRSEIGIVKMSNDPTDAQILAAAKRGGLLNDGVTLSQIIIGGDDLTITIYAADTGEPLGELERDE